MFGRSRNPEAWQRLRHVASQWAGVVVDHASPAWAEDPTRWDAVLATQRDVLAALEWLPSLRGPLVTLAHHPEDAARFLRDMTQLWWTPAQAAAFCRHVLGRWYEAGG